jgi:hypothetical protein
VGELTVYKQCMVVYSKYKYICGTTSNVYSQL